MLFDMHLILTIYKIGTVLLFQRYIETHCGDAPLLKIMDLVNVIAGI